MKFRYKRFTEQALFIKFSDLTGNKYWNLDVNTGESLSWKINVGIQEWLILWIWFDELEQVYSAL